MQIKLAKNANKYAYKSANKNAKSANKNAENANKVAKMQIKRQMYKKI